MGRSTERDLETLRVGRRRQRQAAYTRAWRSDLRAANAPECRDVERALFGIVAKMKIAPAVVERLVKRLAVEGYAPDAARRVVERMVSSHQ